MSSTGSTVWCLWAVYTIPIGSSRAMKRSNGRWRTRRLPRKGSILPGFTRVCQPRSLQAPMDRDAECMTDREWRWQEGVYDCSSKKVTINCLQGVVWPEIIVYATPINCMHLSYRTVNIFLRGITGTGDGQQTIIRGYCEDCQQSDKPFSLIPRTIFQTSLPHLRSF